MSNYNTTIQSLIEALQDKYGGKAISMELSDYLVRRIYPMTIPFNFRNEGETDRPLFTFMGLHVANGYQRIIYTDYGPFLEIGKENIIKAAIQQSSGTSQEAESNVSNYLIYKSADGMAQIRLQTRSPSNRMITTDMMQRNFAVNKYYISPYDVCPGTLMEIEDGNLMPDINHSLVCQPVSCHGRYQDKISREVSVKWPFVEEEYKALCGREDALALLGTFQVIVTAEDNVEGIVNLFCDMSSVKNRHRAGINYEAMVNAIYQICSEAPEYHVVIPFGIGCPTEEKWKEVHLMLSCRLCGKNVSIVKQRTIAGKNAEPAQLKLRNGSEVLESVAAVMFAEEGKQEEPAPVTNKFQMPQRKTTETAIDEPVRSAKTADTLAYAIDLVERVSAEDRPYLIDIFTEIGTLSSSEIRALTTLLRRVKPESQESDWTVDTPHG